MAKQLLQIPMDRGIDQSKATGGMEQATGLVACSNLWHARKGELSTRPGTERAGGDVGITSIQNRKYSGASTIGRRSLVLAAGDVYSQSQPQATESEAWANIGEYALPIPTYRRTLGDDTAAGEVAKHCALWRHLLLVGHNEGTTVILRSYDRATGVLLWTDTLTNRTICGWATHDSTTAPTLFVKVVADTLLRRHLMTDADTGKYDTAGAEVFSGLGTSDTAYPVGHAAGACHVGITDGRVFYLANQAAVFGSSLADIDVITSAFGGGGYGTSIAFFAGITGGNLSVLRATSLLGQTDTEATSMTRVVLVPGSTTTQLYALLTDGSGSGTFARAIIGSTGGFTGSEFSYMPGAIPLGGAWHDAAHRVSYCWFKLNETEDEFSKTVLVDIRGSTNTQRRIALDASMISEPPASGTGHIPQAAFDGDGSLAVILPERIDGRAAPVVFEWRSHATRSMAEYLGSTLIPGGALYDAIDVSEPTVPHIGPRLDSGTQGTAGSLTVLGTYRYRFVYQTTDANGTVRQSTPSSEHEVTLTGSNDDYSLEFDDDHTVPDGWEIVSYRTVAGGTIFYRDSPESVTILPGDTYVSTRSDGAISDGPLLYTSGNTLSNDPAPSHRFLAVGKRRAWLGGLWRPYRLQFSKDGLRGEVPAFPDDPSHWMDLEQDLTALAVMDDVVLAFHAESVNIVTGDGPDVTGAGSFQIRPVAVGIGADDWRSVVVTPIGVFFAGNRTIWLMGRGFAAPENIGAQVRDILAAFPVVLSSALVDYGHQQAVQFLCSDDEDGTNTTRLVFSLQSLTWYQWDALDADILGSIMVRGERRLWLMPSDVAADGDEPLTETEDATTDHAVDTEDPVSIATAIETQDLSPWGFAAEVAVHRDIWRVRVAEVQTWNHEHILDGGRSHLPSNGYQPPTRDGYQHIEYRLKEQKMQSIAVRLEAGPVTLSGLVLEFEGEGLAKLPTAQRRG